MTSWPRVVKTIRSLVQLARQHRFEMGPDMDRSFAQPRSIPQEAIGMRVKWGLLASQEVFLRGIALLLVLAAGLKWWSGAAISQSASDWSWQLLIGIEVCLALWLVSGVWRRGALQTTWILFSAFSVVAAWKWVRGDTSCGCFGQVIVPPSAIWIVDSAGAGICWWLWREGKPLQRHHVRVGAAVIVMMFGLPLLAKAWSADEAYAVVSEPREVQFTAIQLGNVAQASIDLKNSGSRDIEVAQIQTSCSCASVQLDSRTIRAGEHMRATVQLDTRARAEFAGRLRIEVVARDRAGQALFRLPIRATIEG